MRITRKERGKNFVALIGFLATVIILAKHDTFAVEPDRPIDFVHGVLPTLKARCWECHGPQQQKGSLRLDGAPSALRGGASGQVIVPGSPEDSELLRRIESDDPEVRMPPKGPRLTQSEIVAIRRWIKDGAIWPPELGSTYADTTQDGWAFSRLEFAFPAPSPANSASRPANGTIDEFLNASMETAGLSPSPEADRRNLARRLYVDLWGMLPTDEEVREFVDDSAENAYERLVDRLLASPRYGERYGRHWLDLVRYADSKDIRSLNGPDDMFYAWRYRDYVVDAWNEDLPYNEFLREQIAGDILAERAPSFRRVQRLIAPSVLAIGDWGYGDSDKTKMMCDIVDDQIDLVSRGFMGVTVACARCHDHKYDPFTQRDYYALAGIFFSSHIIPEPGDPTKGTPMNAIPLESEAELASRELAAKQKEEAAEGLRVLSDAIRERAAEQMRTRLRAFLDGASELWKKPNPTLTNASALAKSKGISVPLFRRWLASLELSPGFDPEVGLLSQRIERFLGSETVHGWGSDQTPWAVFNFGNKESRFGAFAIPARTLAVHPAPERPVQIIWRSTSKGKIEIEGFANDVDPACGNGIEWRLDHVTTVGSKTHQKTIAQQVVENGFPSSIGAQGAVTADVKPGDFVILTIDSSGKKHTCDTTAVGLTIREVTGRHRLWSLESDVASNNFRENPISTEESSAPVWWIRGAEEHPYSLNLQEDSVLTKWRSAIRSSSADLSVTADLTTQCVDQLEKSVEQKPWAKELASSQHPIFADLPEQEFLSQDELREQARFREALRDASAMVDRPTAKANGIREGGVPNSIYAGIANARLQIRGQYSRLGDEVPRGAPAKLSEIAGPLKPIESGSGRLELAEWITTKANALTARVIVNRLWAHHFGRGIVSTLTNFGKLGAKPDHPELLDYLAARLIESDWSIKRLQREIVLSNAYRRSSSASNEVRERDPENVHKTHMPRRRLDAETLRDSLLRQADKIDLEDGGVASIEDGSRRRTLYNRVVRSDRGGYRLLFDAADPSAIVDLRGESIIAPQALFVLNHPMIHESAEEIARIALFQGGDSDDAILQWLYRRVLQRDPTEEEIALAHEFITKLESESMLSRWAEWTQILLWSNEFIYVD